MKSLHHIHSFALCKFARDECSFKASFLGHYCGEFLAPVPTRDKNNSLVKTNRVKNVNAHPRLFFQKAHVVANANAIIVILDFYIVIITVFRRLFILLRITIQ